MKKKLVPDEIIIGLRQDSHYEKGTQVKDGIKKLAFFTFKDDGKINSEISWDGWRSKEIEPIILKNEFVEGWRVENNFNQRSGESTRKLFIITEPRSGHQFELDVAPMTKLLQNIEIKNGVIQGKFAFTREKSLIRECDYDAQSDNKEIEFITAKTVKVGDIILKGAKLEKYVFIGKRYGLQKRYHENEIPEETFYLFITLKPNKYGYYNTLRSGENFKYRTQWERCDNPEIYIKYIKDNFKYYYYYVSENPIGTDDKFELITEIDKDTYSSYFYINVTNNQLYRTDRMPSVLMPIQFNGRHFEDSEKECIQRYGKNIFKHIPTLEEQNIFPIKNIKLKKIEN